MAFYYELYTPDPVFAVVQFACGGFGLIDNQVSSKQDSRNNLLDKVYPNAYEAERAANSWYIGAFCV